MRPFNKKYGWYSEKMHNCRGIVHVYKDKEGNEVKVTCVSETPNHQLAWDDVVYMGEVYDWVRNIGYDNFDQFLFGFHPVGRKF